MIVMIDVADFRRLFLYDDWANQEALRSLETISNPSVRSLKLMAHIVAAECLWHARLRQLPQPMAVWPELNLNDSASQLLQLRSIWHKYLTELNANRLNDSVTYKNTKGERYSSRIADILTHVVIHSGYHRGQIAADVRTSGGEPAFTDFIHAVRQGFIA